MALNIITDTFITGEDRGLELANADWVRKFSWGSNWNRIRLGMHYTITGNGTSNITSLIFAWGICNDTDKPYGNTPDNWVGYRNPQTGSGTFTYTANSGNPYYAFSTNRGRFESIQSGSVIGSGNLTTAGFTISKPSSTLKRSMMFLDILRATPNYSLNLWTQESAANHGHVDFPPWRFGQQTTQQVGQVDSAVATVSNTVAIAANESTGILDSMNVYWNEPTYPLRIHQLIAVRYF